MEFTVKQIPFEKVTGLPTTLFKYRDWSDEKHKTILTEQIVYLAPPSSFPDPLDCKLPKRYDLMTKEDIFKKYLFESRNLYPNWSRRQHREFAREWRKKSPLNNMQYVRDLQERSFDEFDSQFGVLSLTANPKNQLMWEKYSDEHKGFCVGWKFNKIWYLFGSGIPVQYYDTLPEIHWNDSFEQEHFKRVASKETKWECEEEYRIYEFNPVFKDSEKRKRKIPSESFSCVVFGAKMLDQHKEEIVKACKINRLDVEYFSVKIVDGSKELELTKVEI